MLDIMKSLEPRYEERDVTLVNELDEFTEVYFFNKGTYEIGFEINHQSYYCLRYKNSNCIGAYGVTFNVRALFKYKTFTNCYGYSIRKSNWQQILADNEQIMAVVKESVKENYEKMVKRKLLKAKHNISKKWLKRSDYTAFLSVQEIQTKEQHIKATEREVSKSVNKKESFDKDLSMTNKE